MESQVTKEPQQLRPKPPSQGHIFAVAAIWGVLIGFALPYLISAASTELVLLGVAIAAAHGYYTFRVIKRIQEAFQ